MQDLHAVYLVNVKDVTIFNIYDILSRNFDIHWYLYVYIYIFYYTVIFIMLCIRGREGRGKEEEVMDGVGVIVGMIESVMYYYGFVCYAYVVCT